MKRPVREIRTLLNRAFRGRGASEAEAALFADVLIEAELRGRPTHGLNRVSSILKFLQQRPPGRPEVVQERGSLVRIDGGDQSGYLVAAFMADQAIRVARREGHALVGAWNTRHSGMLGYYAYRIVRNELIAILFADCAPMVTPWGAAEGVLGTNPIAAAFPASPHPILIDMGTAAITYGTLDCARRAGKRVPRDCGLNAEGQPTTDPNAVKTILPFGQHRGYALCLLVQLLAGVVVGAAAVPESFSNYGILMLAMKPGLFTTRSSYDAGVQELIERIKSARPRESSVEILLPGERAFRERERRLNEGISVSEEQWTQLESLGS